MTEQIEYIEQANRFEGHEHTGETCNLTELMDTVKSLQTRIEIQGSSIEDIKERGDLMGACIYGTIFVLLWLGFMVFLIAPAGEMYKYFMPNHHQAEVLTPVDKTDPTISHPSEMSEKAKTLLTTFIRQEKIKSEMIEGVEYTHEETTVESYTVEEVNDDKPKDGASSGSSSTYTQDSDIKDTIISTEPERIKEEIEPNLDIVKEPSTEVEYKGYKTLIRSKISHYILKTINLAKKIYLPIIEYLKKINT